MRLVFVLDCNDADRLAAFWAAAIGYRVSSSSDPYVVLVPETDDGPELVLQRVGERRTACISTSGPQKWTRPSSGSLRSAPEGFSPT
jgi:hypothetical protein